MQMKKIIKRLPLLSWLLIPGIALWASTSYLIYFISRPSEPTVLGQTTYQTVPGQTTRSISETPTTINNQEKFFWKKEGLVTLWFDDAWESQYSLAYPSLEQRGFKAALAVPTNLVGYEAYMDWHEIQRLQYKGWEITSHTRSHACELDKDNPNSLDYEIAGGKQDLLSKGLRAEIFVSPCGVKSALMDEVVKKSHLAERTSEQGFNPLPIADPYYLKVQTIRVSTNSHEVITWLNEASKNKSWLILAFHQIGSGGEEYSTTPETLRAILDLIENSDLSVVLPSQVLSIKL